MTNGDKYLKDGVDVEEFIGEFNDFISRQTENQSACVRLAQFLKYPVKPTLTEDEKVILRNVPQRYHTIGRWGNGTLCLKCNDMDDYGTETDCEIDVLYGLLFQFIQPRRRI